MRIHVMELLEGDRLRTDVFNRAGLHVLPKGTSIRTEEIALLIRQSIDYVDIEPRGSEASEPEGEQTDIKERIKENFDLPLKGFQSIFLEALTTGKFNQSMVDQHLEPMLEVLDRNKDVVSLLIAFTDDDVNIYNHSLQVGLLSYYIATWLGYSAEECYEISRAGYLHDIGKSRVRQSLRNREHDLTGADLEELQRHTSYGYEIIRNSMGEEKTALVALQHHEREDGTGYPQALGKAEIHPYAEIVAVADVFVGMTAPDGSRSRQDLLTVLRKTYELGFGKLNEKAVQALTRHLLPNFIGKKARLSNGETVTIVWNNPADIFKPLVRIDEERFRDLSKERSIELEQVFI
ncbi:HD domain-containing protein [Paenibacillus oralis]|uniref:HD domain-containing protein n=1 Tax=Paenibacillus oralis TaxID=2490856 RepID=A0A3P3U744_9BACL|nr:HD domain-containing phosphohydrolase [Paenibacillus oralis]RRJ66191.1 HD domain-containing protein [Paenibacillus oralis]